MVLLTDKHHYFDTYLPVRHQLHLSMPPRTKALAGFSSLIESDSEPDFASPDTPPAQMARVATQTKRATRPRGRPPVNPDSKVTKPSQRGGRRTSAGVASRQALQERSNNELRGVNRPAQVSKSISDEADPLDNEFAMPMQPTRGRPKTSKEYETKSAGTEQNVSKPKRGRPPKARATPIEETPESPPTEPMEVDEGEPQQASQYLEHTVDADAESGEPCIDSDSDDASLRRRLGELTKRYKSLEARYGDLRDIGVKDAERNYDRLRKQSEENSAGQSNYPIFNPGTAD